MKLSCLSTKTSTTRPTVTDSTHVHCFVTSTAICDSHICLLSPLYIHTHPSYIRTSSRGPLKLLFTMATLKFAPWQSDVDVQFYAALAHIKINHDKLDDSARKVLGLYETRPGDHCSRSMRIQIHPNALTSDECVPPLQPNTRRC